MDVSSLASSGASKVTSAANSISSAIPAPLKGGVGMALVSGDKDAIISKITKVVIAKVSGFIAEKFS